MNKIVNRCKACNEKLEHVRKCSQCMIAFYCSPECQRKDWPEHKKKCTRDEQAIKDRKMVMRIGNIIKDNKDILHYAKIANRVYCKYYIKLSHDEAQAICDGTSTLKADTHKMIPNDMHNSDNYVVCITVGAQCRSIVFPSSSDRIRHDIIEYVCRQDNTPVPQLTSLPHLLKKKLGAFINAIIAKVYKEQRKEMLDKVLVEDGVLNITANSIETKTYMLSL